MNARYTARALYQGFKSLLERYYVPPNFVGSYHTRDFDFYKFMGHELFVTFFSFLIRESRWELITELLEEDIYVENAYGRNSELVPFTYVSHSVELLNPNRQGSYIGRISPHADLLNERHTKGEMGKLVPMQQFMEADYFLFLRAEVSQGWGWGAWSTLYLEQAPRFLIEASSAKYAQLLLRPLGVKNIADFRQLLTQSTHKIKQKFGNPPFFTPLGNFTAQIIGSR